MFKFLGHALGHSFGLVVIVLVNALGAAGMELSGANNYTWMVVIDLLYTGGYACLPLALAINKLLEGRTIRKQIKVEMSTHEWAKNFNYEIGKKAQKQIDKINIKNVKKPSPKDDSKSFTSKDNLLEKEVIE